MEGLNEREYEARKRCYFRQLDGKLPTKFFAHPSTLELRFWVFQQVVYAVDNKILKYFLFELFGAVAQG